MAIFCYSTAIVVSRDEMLLLLSNVEYCFCTVYAIIYFGASVYQSKSLFIVSLILNLLLTFNIVVL